jgi:hypothetical protein
MKMKVIPVLLVLAFSLMAPMAMAAKPSTNGFDEFGYNYGARLFNGWYGQWADKPSGTWSGETLDAYLVMKWSDDWIPQADEPVGAWCTNHWTWYSNDVEEGTWYGWDTRVDWTLKDTPPLAEYKVEEFLKIMKVGDVPAAWAEYSAGGAYSAGWGSYASSVPRYVVFQDTLTIYKKTWSLVGQYVWIVLGTYTHDLLITQQNPDGTFSGTGGYPAGQSPYTDPGETSETITGQITGDQISLTTTYLGPYNPGYTATAIGTIASDGSMGGTVPWVWYTISGNAAITYPIDEIINLCTTSPKGLGKPIF